MSWQYRIKGLRKISLTIENLIFNLLWARKLGNKVRIFGWPIISIYPGASIQVGKNVVLISDAYFSEPGISHPVIIRSLKKDVKIIIGDDVGISGGGICAAEKVVIGKNVMFGANAFVTDTDFHPLENANRRYSVEKAKTAPVEIGNNVFLGMNVLVLKGVTIGYNSVIAAGSIVTADIPKNVIAAGTPASVIRSISKEI
jgi:acetyltransferase-like isoleucine patch superfamily enzyme